MFERFTASARRVVVLAQDEARALDHDHIGTEHLLLALVLADEGIAAGALVSLGAGRQALRAEVERAVGDGQHAPSGRIPMTPRLSKVFELSGTEALLLNHEYIAPAHLLMGLIREGGGTAVECLTALGIALDQLRGQVRHLLSRAQPGSVDVPPTRVLPALPVLDQSGRNLTTEAREGRLDPVIGRRAELTRLIQVLLLRTRNSAMLVGETGVGKTTLAEGLAQEIVRANVPLPLRDVQLHALDLGAFETGSRGATDLQTRLEKLRDELSGRKDVILFIEDVQTLIGGGDTEHAINTAAVLKPMLLRGELRLIVTTTPAEHRRFLEKNAALQRRFQPIEVAEPTVAQTLEILKALRDRYETHHHVRFTDDFLAAVAELADQNFPDRPMPGKAIDLLDLAGAQARTAGQRDLFDLDERISEVRREKEARIDAQDFAGAAELRDAEKQLLRSRKEIATAPYDSGMEVDMATVMDALANISGGSPIRTAGDRPGKRRPAPVTDHDPEIWAMS